MKSQSSTSEPPSNISTRFSKSKRGVSGYETDHNRFHCHRYVSFRLYLQNGIRRAPSVRFTNHLPDQTIKADLEEVNTVLIHEHGGHVLVVDLDSTC